MPPAGHAVQDGITTGIEGLDQFRIGIGPQRHRGGITLVGDEGPERAMPLHRGEDQGMGSPQQETALVSLHGQPIDLTTPALQIGPDLGWQRRRVGGFQGLQHLFEGEPCASRPPEGGRGEAIHSLACRGTDQFSKAGEGRFESCRVLVWTRHDRERAVLLDGERTRGHGETPH